jgi:ABC-type transport system involved in cytochrome c biogenesis ATPase subunit
VSGLTFNRVWTDTLKGVSLELSSGLLVIVGDASDGSASLVELCAGVSRPRRGQVRLDDAAPHGSPRLRRGIASLLAHEATPAAGSVRGWVRGLAALLGSSLEAELPRLGLPLDRPLVELSNAERRQLACALALAHPAPRLTVLHDPLSACAPDTRQHVIGRLLERSRQGPVLVTTPSHMDARLLGGSSHVLDRGLLSEAAGGAWPDSSSPGLDIWMYVEADAPRALVAALAQQPDVHELSYDEPRGGRLLLRGPDLERLCNAVARAAVSGRVNVRTLRAAAEDLAATRAAASGAAAAYAAARARAGGAP